MALPKVCFTLDVLTNGSEFTGHGTVFLSVWRKSRQAPSADNLGGCDTNWLKDMMDLGPPLSRYAITGLGDATARLCADQRLKLAKTRAVFLPSEEGLDGLSALLLALHSAGAPSLHVVSTDEDAVEELATIVLGRRHMSIMNCQVPIGKQPEETAWWMVYNDEYLTVHASRRQRSPSSHVTFLISIKSSDGNYTLALLPPGCLDVDATYRELLQEQLPLLEDDTPMIIRDILALDLKQATRGSLPNKVTLMATMPDLSSTSNDPGLLIRSQKLARHLRDNLPSAFSETVPTEAPQSLPGSIPKDELIRLRSGSSIVLDIENARSTLVVMDRRQDTWARPVHDEWSGTLQSLQTLLARPGREGDENEILLDESDDEEAAGLVTENHSPKLLVLGTGCASPSATRGASGYALSFPATASDSDNFILDCGEGVTLMLSRNVPDLKSWANQIRGIWISHAHLDHYGGLPTLLRTIWAQETTRNAGGHPSKKPKLSEPLWVVAPPKVLRFVDISLQSRHGWRGGSQIFSPRVHQDPTIPRGPWDHFVNVRVYHNCCPSYGLLLGWAGPSQSQHWLCFSGDTRPCASLVRACQSTMSKVQSKNLLMIHEATFADNEQKEAESKKHSTVTEALQVSADCGASRVLLTHFSQRYVSLDCGDPNVPHTIPMGLAVDGLWLSLEG